MNFPPITLGVIWSSIKAQQLITTLKSIFSWKNKSGKVLSFRFVSMQNDQIEKNYLCNHLHLLYTLVYKCSYRIPWCYYKPHQNYNCGFLCHTHRCLKSYLSVIETQFAFCVLKTSPLNIFSVIKRGDYQKVMTVFIQQQVQKNWCRIQSRTVRTLTSIVLFFFFSLLQRINF